MIISLAIIAVLIIIPLATYASNPLTKSFGGKVKLTTVPLVTCTGAGTGPVVISNISGIPLYANSLSKTPRVGDWILGTTSIIPDFSTCQITAFGVQLPFPVRKTSNYNISGTTSYFGF